MILSSPFSRQNKSHQTWHSRSATPQSDGHSHNRNNNNNNNNNPHQIPNGLAKGGTHPYQNIRPYSSASLGRRPAPQQPAPERPRVVPEVMSNGHSTQAASTHSQYRASTLNRLDLLKQRHQRGQPPRRNLSSLGYYTDSADRFRQTLAGDGHAKRPVAAPPSQQIYAPASIASPRELAHNSQQHYAATSVRGNQSSASFDMSRSSAVPSRSGRESALSGLFERFGTLKRKARRRWPTLSSRSSSRYSKSLAAGGESIYASPGAIDPAFALSASGKPGGQLDGEIYAHNKTLKAEQIYAEGSRAIDGNGQRRLLEHELDPSLMYEGETRTLIGAASLRQPDYQQLVGVLTGWINDELADQRIIVRDLQDDLYDGQVLCKLVERLHGVKLDMVDMTQNELTQRQKLKTVLDTLNRVLALQARWARIRWSSEGIHSKNLVEIIHLLVTLALYYRAPIRMPPNVVVNVLVVTKHKNELIKRSHQAQLTDNLVVTLDLCNNSANQRDAFDMLIESAPDKLAIVERSLVKFCNRHLNKIHMSCDSALRTEFSANTQSPPTSNILDPNQFSDGLLLVFLISSLEDYFVPLGNLFTTIKNEDRLHSRLPSPMPYIDGNSNSYITGGSIAMADSVGRATAIEPSSYINTQPIERLHNVHVALQLIEEAGVEIRQRVRAEDVVNGDLKAVLRVLYALFNRYKHL